MNAKPPPGFIPAQDCSPFERRMGEILVSADESGRTGFAATPKNDNGTGVISGGTLITLACRTLATLTGNADVRPLSFHGEFIRPAQAGDFVEGRATLLHHEGTILSAQGRLTSGGNVLFTFGGTFALGVWERPTPQNMPVPRNYEHWDRRAGTSALFGPFYTKQMPGFRQCGVPVQPYHLDNTGAMHPGFAMMFADFSFGPTGFTMNAGLTATTVTLTADFLAPAGEGAFVIAETNLVRETRTMMFMDGKLTVGGHPLLAYSGVMKKVPGRPHAGSGSANFNAARRDGNKDE